MLKDFFDSFDKMNLAELSLPELVHLDEMTAYYENVADLSRQRAKINQEYMNRKENYNDLRFAVHEIKTGYKVANWRGDRLSADQLSKYHKREQYGWNPNFAWKFHLDVVPNRNHPVTKAISDFLIDLCVTHKIASGGENGKGMTVYVGSYDDICKLAHVIQEKFGSQISKPPFYTDQVDHEYAFEATVYGRFCVGGFGYYPQAIKGISPFDTETYKHLLNIEIVQSEAQKLNIAANGLFDPLYLLFEDNPNYKVVRLTAYCSHKLYVAVFGQYYCGKYLRPFEEKFFGDKIPARGTPLRQKWDKVADTFVQEAKEQGFFETMRNNVRGYIPLDLSRFTNEKQTSFEYIRNDNSRQ